MKFGKKDYRYHSGHMKRDRANEQRDQLKNKGFLVRIREVHQEHTPIFRVYKRKRRKK